MDIFCLVRLTKSHIVVCCGQKGCAMNMVKSCFGANKCAFRLKSGVRLDRETTLRGVWFRGWST